jgi:hypothetical protein
LESEDGTRWYHTEQGLTQRYPFIYSRVLTWGEQHNGGTSEKALQQTLASKQIKLHSVELLGLYSAPRELDRVTDEVCDERDM